MRLRQAYFTCSLLKLRATAVPTLEVADNLVVKLDGTQVSPETDPLVDRVLVQGLVQIGRGVTEYVLRDIPHARSVSIGCHVSGLNRALALTVHARRGDEGVISPHGLDGAGQ